MVSIKRLVTQIALDIPLACVAQKFSLSDLQWTLKNSNGSIAVPGSVPSQAHLDLLRAGIITEPLLGINGMSLALLVLRSTISHFNTTQISRSDGLQMRIGRTQLIFLRFVPLFQENRRRRPYSFSTALIQSQTL